MDGQDKKDTGKSTQNLLLDQKLSGLCALPVEIFTLPLRGKKVSGTFLGLDQSTYRKPRPYLHRCGWRVEDVRPR